MFISIDTQKAFDKVQHPFMIKILSKLLREGNFLNWINIYKTPAANIILNDKKFEAFPVSSGTRQDVPSYHCFSM